MSLRIRPAWGEGHLARLLSVIAQPRLAGDDRAVALLRVDDLDRGAFLHHLFEDD
jgi:hypothetical protein